MLKTEYKFIRFEKQVGRDRWYCFNKKHGDMLGGVAYLSRWRCFVFQPPSGTEFSADCLRDIADFLEQLNRERKGKKG
jgi:hypothetical protein